MIRPGAIGDVVVSLPALEFLRADYTEVWTPSATVPLVRFADRVRAISSTGLDLLEIGRAPDSLVSTLAGFDDIVSWYGAASPEFKASAKGLPFRFFPALPGEQTQIHAVDFYLAQVGAPPGGIPRVECPRAERTRLALHPFSGSAKKNWPLECFQALAAREPFEWCHERFEDLGALADWLAGARVFVGNDSGITHLAAAVGAPVVALFGPTDPRVWAPPGAKVIRGNPMTAITVDVVHRAVIDLLR